MSLESLAAESPICLEQIERDWLNACGACDAGLTMSCTCPAEDYRPVMLTLVREVERLRGLVGPCPECLDPDEDPRPWCDCIDGDDPCFSVQCRQRAHPPSRCGRRQAVTP